MPYGGILVDTDGCFWVYASIVGADMHQIQVDMGDLPPTRGVAWGPTNETIYCLGEDGVVRARSNLQYGRADLPSLLPVPVPIHRVYCITGLLLLGEDGSVHSMYPTYVDRLPFPAPVREVTGSNWEAHALTERGGVFEWRSSGRSHYVAVQLQEGKPIDPTRLLPPRPRPAPVPLATIAHSGSQLLALSHDDRLFVAGDVSLFQGRDTPRYANQFIEQVGCGGRVSGRGRWGYRKRGLPHCCALL